jgi:hypothetical protein
MLLHRLLSWIRGKGHGATHPQEEPGVVITARLKELVPNHNPKDVRAAFPAPENEEDKKHIDRERFGT